MKRAAVARNPHRLSSLQSAFQAFLLRSDQTIVSGIAGSDDSFRRSRLDIYQSAYRLRLSAALTTDFPALKALVGDGLFEKIARAYIDAHPSSFRNLRWYGYALPGFLREHSAFNQEPVLSEMAEFEWAQGLAFDAPDAVQLQLSALSDLAPRHWAALRFVPHPSVQLITTHTNIVAIWHAFKSATALPEVTSSHTASSIAIWRRDYQTWFRTLATDEAGLWHTLTAGNTFGDACAWLAHARAMSEEDAARRAASLLGTWLQEGWIQSFEGSQAPKKVKIRKSF